MGEAENYDYDVLVMGTGPTEAILAAGLARHGLRVVHVDPRSVYGETGSVLTLQELFEVEGCEAVVPDPSRHPTLMKDSRKYSIELSPKLIYSSGALVDLMIKSNVSNYLEFRAVETTHFWWENGLEAVPSSKEDIFSNESIGLLEKRRLMKLLSKFVDASLSPPGSDGAGTHEADLVEKVVDPEDSMPFVEFLEKQGLAEKSRVILFNAIGLYVNKNDYQNISKKEGTDKIQKYLSSIGRFGSTPFLSGVYGTASEVSQAFSRVCAVHGGTYILSYSPISATVANDGVFNIKSNDKSGDGKNESSINTKWIVASPSCASQFQGTFAQINAAFDATPIVKRISRCVAILEEKLSTVGEPGLVIIPSGDKSVNGIIGLQQSNNALVCPEGKFLIYLSKESETNSTARSDLEESLNSLLSVGEETVKPLATAYYTQTIHTPCLSKSWDRIIVTNDSSEAIGFEECVKEAKSVFERIVGPGVEFLPAIQNDDEDN
ncbi:GDP dissociation inhibitor [Obelidium mucronatum]|nr:GDP dissociation inhibitor [Obelidium mucronatum]